MKKRKLFKVGLKVVFLFSLVFVSYTFSPYKIEFLGHYNKIWAHRANSIQKLNSALNYYDGVELDLVYNEEKDFFDIKHTSSKSYNIRFEDYIRGLEKPEKLKGIWLDIKNLNKDNSKAILSKLTTLLRIINIDYKSVLIETRYPEALPIFTKTGFKSSYYLPYFLYEKDNKELQDSITKIKKILRAQPDLGISSSHKDYYIMRQYFPNRSKYIWDLVWPINLDVFLTKEILNDDSVKIILVHYFALQGNSF